MPNEIRNVIEKYKTTTFNNELIDKYRFFKKYGSLNIKLIK